MSGVFEYFLPIWYSYLCLLISLISLSLWFKIFWHFSTHYLWDIKIKGRPLQSKDLKNLPNNHLGAINLYRIYWDYWSLLHKKMHVCIYIISGDSCGFPLSYWCISESIHEPQFKNFWSKDISKVRFPREIDCTFSFVFFLKIMSRNDCYTTHPLYVPQNWARIIIICVYFLLSICF